MTGITAPAVRLSAFSHGAGCACKLGPGELAQVMGHLSVPAHADLLVGTATGDDAAVWRLSPDRALVATVDFFTPIVDDARTWGAIAAANAASDVYAMGGRPLCALNVVGWPRDKLPLDLLGEVVAGGAEVAARGGWLVVGGHTVDVAEPLYGQCVLGEVHPDRMMTNDAAVPGQAIILTKALGTGVVSTAVKRMGPDALEDGGRLAVAYALAVSGMIRLNDDAGRIAASFASRAATDITGFGLTGHLHKLARSSGVAIEIDLASLPVIEGVTGLIAEGFVPGGTGRNLEFVQDHLDTSRLADPDAARALLADPQTSGGLAFCIDRDRADDALAELRAGGHASAVIGHTVAAEAAAVGRLTVY